MLDDDVLTLQNFSGVLAEVGAFYNVRRSVFPHVPFETGARMLVPALVRVFVASVEAEISQQLYKETGAGPACAADHNMPSRFLLCRLWPIHRNSFLNLNTPARQ